MRTFICILFVGGIFVHSYGQSKGQIRDLGIKSTTVFEYDYSNGKGGKRIESVKKFNNHGDVIEFIDYDKSGEQKERIVYKYNENFDIIEEIYYDDANKPKKTYKYTYNGRLKKTREKYDSNNNLLWKKEYVYEM